MNAEFNFKNPDYREIFNKRLVRLQKIRKNPEMVQDLKNYYRENIVQFINHWGCTYEPRNLAKNLPAVVPFILFERQVEWVEWFIQCWKSQEPGSTLKSRDSGVTWMAVAASVGLCVFNDGLTISFGSRKREYVDNSADPKSIFHKIRQFTACLPREFRGGWVEKKNAFFMKNFYPATASMLTGESGDGIGRGNRTSISIIDELAHIPRAHLIDYALSATTDCRIDISTPRGMDNSFAKRHLGGKIKTFDFHWRSDPRKDDVWYQKQCNILDDPVIIAQELDMSFTASMDDVIIPHEWILAAIDAHIKLGIVPTGQFRLALDVSDEGGDKNALAAQHGILITHVEEWSGRDSDLYETTQKTIDFSLENGYTSVVYDADGLGAGVRGDARKINETYTERALSKDKKYKPVEFIPFFGSGAVLNKEDSPFRSAGDSGDSDFDGRTNEDYFENLKAQGWFELRKKFRATYRAVVKNAEFKEDEIISLSSEIPNLLKIVSELSQPRRKQTATGKMLVDKKPEGTPSPNCADAIMMLNAPQSNSWSIFDAAAFN